MSKSKTDISKMQAKHRAIIAAGPKARQAFLREAATPAVRDIERQAPRDTRRYVRAYMEAANDVGIPSVVPEVRESEFLQTVVYRLRMRLALWEKRMELYRRDGRTDEKYYRKIVRNVERMREMGMRYTKSAIVIFGKGDQTIHRTISEIFGGVGKFVESGNRTFLQFVNREPHARIVESRHLNMRALFGKATKGTGVSRAKAAHLKVLKAEAKLGGK